MTWLLFMPLWRRRHIDLLASVNWHLGCSYGINVLNNIPSCLHFGWYSLLIVTDNNRRCHYLPGLQSYGYIVNVFIKIVKRHSKVLSANSFSSYLVRDLLLILLIIYFLIIVSLPVLLSIAFFVSPYKIAIYDQFLYWYR